MNRRIFVSGLVAVGVVGALPKIAIGKELTSHVYRVDEYNTEINLKSVFHQELEYDNAEKRFEQEISRPTQNVAHVGFITSNPEPLDLGDEAYVFDVEYDSLKAWLVRVLDGDVIYGFACSSNTDKGKDELIEAVTKYLEEPDDTMIEFLEEATGNGWFEEEKE